MLHLRRHSPFSRISKIANPSAARICENRDSVELIVCTGNPSKPIAVVIESKLIVVIGERKPRIAAVIGAINRTFSGTR
jgi:hypothetical protein